MPPFVGRKRFSLSPVPAPPPPAKRPKISKPAITKPQPPILKKQESRFTIDGDSDSDSSSLSDVDSDDFEDIPPSSKTVKSTRPPRTNEGHEVDNDDDEGEGEDEDEDEDVEWEDAPAQSTAPDFSHREFKDIKITVDRPDEPDYTVRSTAKKGSSKREKQARLWAHQMHVQFLLWHNAKRNIWLNDKKLHDILLNHLPIQITREIEKWRRASGLSPTIAEHDQTSPKDKKKKVKKWKANGERNERDWGHPSQRLEQGKPDMSHGDPLITLLKVLAAFWKKKFAVTAPGLRKRGYGSKLALRKDIDSYRNEKHHPAKHGEKIESLLQFRQLAEKCKGSRDLGAQLFTALLRAIGIETRLVASLQPAGFGFTKLEEMLPRKIIDPESSSLSDADSVHHTKAPSKSRKKPPKSISVSQKMKIKRQTRRSVGNKDAPIDLDSNTDELSSSDSESVIDVTPNMPKSKPAKYDKDLLFPIYWAEAISPITSKVYPVSPLVLEIAVATSAEILAAFEPRGAKADKTRQVMAYVVAFSSDCSAKDVTVRYLRKRLWPGKTKGFRLQPEKVPIYDTRGKVKRYEEHNWFSHALSIYRRSDDHRTAVDDIEDVTDLVPAQPEKKEADGDTLQSLKASADFVIERHLRREEALLPKAKPVRYFTFGKGEKQEELPIYKRSDVRKVMTAESWHKEGRAPKEGEVPMKLAPVRAVTLARKREAEEHLIRTGEKQMQALYSQDQTDWIIPPPIKDGKIPKNSYGNIDCFVPSMVPKGAIHLPLKGTVRICKKLEIDYAEAVVGFEFGNKMAVPVIHGVVIAKENEQLLRDAWRIWNEEQRKKEETKMEKLVLELWRKFATGLVIRSRVQEEYGLDLNLTTQPNGTTIEEAIDIDIEEPVGVDSVPDENEFGGGFLVDHEDETHHGEELTLEHHSASQENRIHHQEIDLSGSQEYPTPISPSTRTKKSTRKRSKLIQKEHVSYEEQESTCSSHNHGTAGSFFQDNNDDSHKGLVDLSSPPSASSDEEDKVTPELNARAQARAQPQRLAARAVSKTLKTTTRRTPARTPMSRANPMDVDDATALSDVSDSGEDHQISTLPSSSSTSQINVHSRGKKQSNKQKSPRSRKTVEEGGASTPKFKKRGARRESTVVTSPYF